MVPNNRIIKKLFTSIAVLLVAISAFSQKAPSFRFPPHYGKINNVQFNKDQSILYTAGYDGVIKMWNYKTGEPINEVFAYGMPGGYVAINQQEGYFFTNNIGRAIRKWSSTFELIKEQKFESNADFVYHEEKGLLAIHDYGYGVKIYDDKTLDQITYLEPAKFLTTAIAFSPDGNYLFYQNNEMHLVGYDTKTWELTYKSPGTFEQVIAIDFMADQTLIATNYRENPNKWDVFKNNNITDFGDFDFRSLKKLIVLPKSQNVAVFGNSKLYVLDGKNGSIFSEIEMAKNVKQMLIADDEDNILFRLENGVIQVYDVTINQVVKEIGTPVINLNLVRASDDKEDELILISSDRTIYTIDINQQSPKNSKKISRQVGRKIVSFNSKSEVVSSIPFSSLFFYSKDAYEKISIRINPEYTLPKFAGRYMGYLDNTCLQLIPRSDKEEKISICQNLTITDWEYLKKDNSVILAIGNNLVTYDLSDQSIKDSIHLDYTYIKDISISPLENKISFLGNSDKFIHYDLENQQVLKEIEFKNSSKITYDPTGKHVAITAFFRRGTVMDMENYSLLETDKYPSSRSIDDLVFSPDSKYLAIIDADEVLSLYDLEESKAMDLKEKHQYFNTANSVTFLPNTEKIAFISGYNQLVIFDLKKQKVDARYVLINEDGGVRLVQLDQL